MGFNLGFKRSSCVLVSMTNHQIFDSLPNPVYIPWRGLTCWYLHFTVYFISPDVKLKQKPQKNPNKTAQNNTTHNDPKCLYNCHIYNMHLLHTFPATKVDF